VIEEGRAKPAQGVTVEVPATLSGVRVDRGVAMLADVSRAVAAELVEAGRVFVDGVPVASGRRLPPPRPPKQACDSQWFTPTTTSR
jgi:RNA-binding protein YlmH